MTGDTPRTLAPSQTAVEPVALAQALKNLTEGAEQEDREILYAAASALTAQAAALVAAEKERDEALDRVEELEAEGEAVSTEFEKDCWKAMRSLLDECNFDWSWVDQDDGVSAEEAREHISETINGIEGDRKAAVARAEAAETEVATLKWRVAELEAGLERTISSGEALMVLLNPSLLPAGAEQQLEATAGQFTRARRLTHQEKNNGR